SILDAKILRRDQIWFMEKDNEQTTQLYPLSDFHPRKKEALEKGYLQGRFGAVPYIGEVRF
uniref:AAA family ATPase n=1 Tax=Candidatus Electrothrix sp. TaxID=2170559 RepID=UPI004055F0A6